MFKLSKKTIGYIAAVLSILIVVAGFLAIPDSKDVMAVDNEGPYMIEVSNMYVGDSKEKDETSGVIVTNASRLTLGIPEKVIADSLAKKSEKATDKKSSKKKKTEVKASKSNTEYTLVNDYFRFYSCPTMDEDDVDHVVDIASISKKYKIPNSWVSFEGCDGVVPNKWALEENGSNLKRELMDLDNQMYNGRHMVALGPAVFLGSKYKGQYVTASEMPYGTNIDVVLENKETGEKFYVPCVVVDIKAHTYPNGYYQTGKARLMSGGIENVPEHADYSVVEFTIPIYWHDGKFMGEGFNQLRPVEFIVYKLDSSMRIK